MADEGEGSHQRTQAEPASQPPKNPGQSAQQPGAGANQLDNTQNNASGSGIEADAGGKANPENTPPKAVQPNEKANPQDASNALETNRTDAPGGSSEAPMKIAQDIGRKIAHLVASGQITKEAGAQLYAQKTGGLRSLWALQEKQATDQDWAHKMAQAQAAGIPPKYAQALLRKHAEDAINPAKISGGTEPVLQSAPGQASPLSQGSEVGQMTPSTRGKDSGRELVSSVENAINATKGQAKNVGPEMSRYLDEPAHSASHDSVLQQSLDNTSGAGVKISSARALLDKWAEHSEENRQALSDAIAKVSQAGGMDPMGAAGGAAPGGGAPGGSVAGGLGGLSAPGGQGPAAGSGAPGMKTAMPTDSVPTEAIEAARAGVTPEELGRAEALLDTTASPGGEPPPEGMGPPPAEPVPQV
jgi:hypothetical protein